MKFNTVSYTLFGVLLACSWTACSLLGLNIAHTAPNKAAKYPKFTLADTLRGALNPARACFDVTHYNLDLSFDYKAKSVRGFVIISAKAVTNIASSLQLDLSSKLKVTAITQSGKQLTFTHKGDVIMVQPAANMAAGDTFSLKVWYEGRPIIAARPPWEGGLVWKHDANKNVWAGVACELIGASIWYPLKDYLGDEPDSASVNITIPKGLVAVSNGTLEKRTVIGENERFEWRTHYPINHYDITFYIGNFVNFEVPYENGSSHFTQSYWVLPEHLAQAKTHFKQATKILNVYEKLFGKYPWQRDGYKLVESPYEGMEHQSAIAYGNGYKTDSRTGGVDYIILHETAHEWWGNAVSVADFADVWIHEGLATYSEALYVEQTQGEAAYFNYLYIYGFTVANNKPMVGPRGVNYWNYKDGDPYTKGAMMLMSLRSTLNNDEQFFDILRQFQFRYRGKTTNSADFIALTNEVTGSDYTWFFKQFLYNRKPAKLVYQQGVANGKPCFTYHWTDTDADFKMPIYIRDGGSLRRLTVTTTPQTVTLKGEGKVGIDMYRFYFTK
jgi:aminopeptidase N